MASPASSEGIAAGTIQISQRDPTSGHGPPFRSQPRERNRAASRRWQADLKAQIVMRNAMEVAPTRAVFASYAALHRRVLHLQNADNARVELAVQNEELAARVRELERTAASYSVRTAREQELERKKDELQDTLREKMEMEKEYYRGLAEASAWREKSAHLEVRATTAESDLACRVSELALVKKEYQALRSENADLRTRVSNSDLYMMACKEANAKIAQLEKKVRELEAEIARLRIVLARGGDGSPAKDNHRIADDEEEDLLADSGDNKGNSAGDGGGSAPRRDGPLGSVDSGGADAAAENYSATTLLNPYPRRSLHVAEDAHRGAVLHSVCVGEGSRLCFTSGSDKVVKIWDCRTGQEKSRFPSGGSIALSLHAASHYLLAGCVDKTARFWDTRTLRALELAGHSEKIVAAALSGSAQHAFTASSDSTIKLWDVSKLAAIKTLLCQSTANDVAVSGNSIFSAHHNGSIVAWDRRAGARSVEVPRVHQRSTTCVRISNDGRLCVSLGKDCTISVRDTRLLTRPLRVLMPSQLEVSMNWSRLALSPDSRVVAVGSNRGQIICCALEKSSEADIFKMCPYFRNSFGASASGSKTVSTATRTGQLLSGSDNQAYDDGVMNVLERDGHDRDSPVPCVAWGAETGAPLASIGDDRRLVLWQ